MITFKSPKDLTKLNFNDHAYPIVHWVENRRRIECPYPARRIQLTAIVKACLAPAS